MALIFDCDGVLLDNMQLHAEVEAAALRVKGMVIDETSLIRRFAGISQREVLTALSRETGVPFDPNFDFDALIYEAYDKIRGHALHNRDARKTDTPDDVRSFRIKPLA